MAPDTLIGGRILHDRRGTEDPHAQIENYIQSMRDAHEGGDYGKFTEYLNMIDAANMHALELGDKDSLTGIMKRKTFENDYHIAHDMLRRNGVPFAVMVADVDKFKSVNDRYGHTTGDDVLIAIVESMREGIRRNDGIYRCGGDEFTGIYSGVDKKGAILAAQRTVERVSDLSVCLEGGEKLEVSISAGIYVVGIGDDFSHAVKKADQALYRAKKNGRNQASM